MFGDVCDDLEEAVKDRETTNNLGREGPRSNESGKSFHFCSKLVKVTEEDMKEKPRRTRNWKGRRAAERNSKKKEAESLPGKESSEPVHPAALPSFPLQTDHHLSAGIDELSEESALTESYKFLEKFIFDNDSKQDERIEENFLEFSDSPSDVESYLRWTPSEVESVFRLERQSKSGFACSAGVSKTGAIPPLNSKFLKDGTCSCRRKDGLTRSGSCACRSFQFLCYLFYRELWEAKQLKRQEEEIIKKIKHFLRNDEERPGKRNFNSQ